MNVLIGKMLSGVYLAEDRKAIKFEVLDGEPIIARTDGDCCSISWIEHVENPEALVGSPILTVADLEMPREMPGSDIGDVTAFYGLKIETAKGTCILDYRNESNGYYGGNLVWPGEYFYGGVYGQNISKEEWQRIA